MTLHDQTPALNSECIATLYLESSPTASSVGCNPSVIRSALASLFSDGACPPVRWELTSPTDIPAETRAAITNVVRDLADQQYCEEIRNGDEGERVRFEPAFTETFAWSDGCDGYHAAFWVSPRRFAIVALSDEHIAPVLHVRHWHPGSMCSGMWVDIYGDLMPGVSTTYRLNDDDGTYFALAPSTTDPTLAIERVISSVWDIYLFNAEAQLLPLLVHGFPAGFEDLNIEYIPDTENPGYEVSASMSNELLEALQEHPVSEIDPETAAYWLELLDDPTMGHEERAVSRLWWREDTRRDWGAFVAYLKGRLGATGTKAGE